MGNKQLLKAHEKKDDEFYTRYTDVANEMQYFTKYFVGKTVYCNCDSEKSNFYKYFYYKFKKLKLKKLIATSIDGNKIVFDGIKTIKTKLNGDNNHIPGDFASDECVDLLREADIVCTNPPFSLWRAFFDLLVKEHKKFIIVGHIMALSYKNCFPFIANKKVFVGNSLKNFDNTKKTVACLFYNNICKRDNLKKIKVNKNINAFELKNIINTKNNIFIPIVDSVKKIPDYAGFMAVPINFLYCDTSDYDIYKADIITRDMTDRERALIYDQKNPRYKHKISDKHLFFFKSDNKLYLSFERIIIKRKKK